jgi:16S rRNA (cytidine1402-2'-O)-methyltransferase
MESSSPGTLFVVATPIGNLEDITLRALRILRQVAVVAAEDTRRTGNLLRHYSIETPLISLHEHNEHRRSGELVARLLRGESVALVSDAGTPGISDPGARFVRAARQAGIRVDPVPGPSAVTAILSASGLSFERFAFAGFPPIRVNDRNKWFEWVASLADLPVVCFEAPHRIERTLDDIRRLLGKRPIIVARELTKLHEEWLFVSDDAAGLARPMKKGEFVLIIGPRVCQEVTQPGSASTSRVPSDKEIGELFGQITEITAPSGRRTAIKDVASRLGLPVKAVYDALERVKN